MAGDPLLPQANTDIEAARAIYLKERQDYLDALQAYDQILGKTAQSVPLPIAMETHYGSEGQGYERAATDPWIVKQHPDLAAAGQRVVTEETEYFALDDPTVSHANASCSIPAYIGEKFYEYAAMAEMLYKLITDEEFRTEVFSQILDSATANIAASAMSNAVSSRAQLGGAVARILGLDDENFRTVEDEYREKAVEHAQVAQQQLAEYFSKKWAEFKESYEGCGLGTAVARVSIDGVFLFGEIWTGTVALKGVRFVYRFARGKHVVDIVDTDGRLLGAAEFDTQALEAKYGKPDDNVTGGVEPTGNRPVPDQSADEALERVTDQNPPSRGGPDDTVKTLDPRRTDEQMDALNPNARRDAQFEYDTQDRIIEDFPDATHESNVVFTDPVSGQRAREFDHIIDGIPIEINNGAGSGKLRQLNEMNEFTGGVRPIIYSPRIGGAAARGIRDGGYDIARTPEELKNLIAERLSQGQHTWRN